MVWEMYLESMMMNLEKGKNSKDKNLKDWQNILWWKKHKDIVNKRRKK